MVTRTITAFHPELIALAEIAKALAHPARLRIVQILAARRECICGDLVEALPLAQATVSQHLKELKRVGLVTGEISGPRTCYGLDREAVARAERALSRLFHELDGRPPEGRDG